MMQKLFRVCLLPLVFALALEAAPLEASAGGRVALVIGNSTYQAVPPLATPSNDAADVAQHLRAIGFDVIEQRDATRDAMAKAIHDFRGRLRSADVALLFYAGHAIQLNGANYLLPVDAKIDNSADVRFDTIDLGDIQKEMDGHTSILLLDACHPNPVADKLAADGGPAAAPGLSAIDPAAPDSLIVFAAQPNSAAQDGTGRNSPFTAALLAHLDTPGLDMREMVAKVRTDVLHATGHKQAPWDNASLKGDVFLVSPGTQVAASPALSPSSKEPAPAAAEPPATNLSSTETSATKDDRPAETPADSAASTTTPTVPDKVAAQNPATSQAPTNDCDKLAALRVPVFSGAVIHEAENIDWAKAVDACQAMLKAHPEEARFAFQLGRAYDNLKDYIPAVHYYQIAADANFAEAQNALGVSYFNGHGVLRSYDAAFSLVNEAAEQGSARALANLSALYADGKGVKKDNAKSLELAEKAVDAGNPFALVVIGNHYFNGAGVEKDYKMAGQYFQQAGDLGNGWALKMLANMYANGYIGPADLAKAGELRYRARLVDPNSGEPAPLPTYHPPGTRTAGTVRRRRYVVFRRFFGFGGCVYVCF